MIKRVNAMKKGFRAERNLIKMAAIPKDMPARIPSIKAIFLGRITGLALFNQI